jgi:hypothetical protein
MATGAPRSCMGDTPSQLVLEGEIEHRDSAGNQGVIGPGGGECQRVCLRFCIHPPQSPLFHAPLPFQSLILPLKQSNG